MTSPEPIVNDVVPMTLGRAISGGFRKYVSGAGRATRAEFWWFYLFAVVVTSPFNLIYQVGVAANQTNGSAVSLFGPAYWLLVLVSLVVGIPLIAAGVRRLHDSGRRGSLLWYGAIPFAGAIILLVLLLKPSTPGWNEYDA